MIQSANDNATPAPAILTGKNSAVGRLQAAMREADKFMQPHRSHRVELLRALAGPWHTTGAVGGLSRPEPVNALAGLFNTLVPLLSLDPSAKIECNYSDDHRGFAEVFELALAVVCDELMLGETYGELTLDALCGPGVSFTGVTVDRDDKDVSYVDRISMDDWIPDVYAKRREAFSFEGDKFSIGWDEANENPLFDKGALSKLQPNQRVTGPDSTQVEGGKPKPETRFVDAIDLIRVYIPSERMVGTLPNIPEGDTTTKFLSESEWNCPFAGPYDQLGYERLPDGLLPLSVAEVVHPLHAFMNRMMNKIGKRADAQKDFAIGDAANPKDAEAARTIGDGEVLLVAGGKDRFGSASIGGRSETQYQAFTTAKDLFNWLGGNPDSLGGQKAQSGTLGQDQLLFANASSRIGYARNRTLLHATAVLRKLAWFLWEGGHPKRTIQVAHAIAPGLFIPDYWVPDQRVGKFTDYTITAKPYGVRTDGPEQKLSRMLNVLEKGIFPMATAGMVQVHGDVVAKELLDLSDVDRGDEMVSAAVPQPMHPPAGAPMSQPGGTTTNISMGGRGIPGGANPQPVQQAQPQAAQTGGE